MNLVIVTQDDRLFIPNTLRAVVDDYAEHIRFAVVSRPSEFTKLCKSISYYLKFWGITQFVILGCTIVVYHLGDMLRIKRFSSCRRILERRRIPVFFGEIDVNSDVFINRIKEAGTEYIVSIASNRVFRSKLLNAPSKMCVNIHAGFLPRNRGFNPTFWALYKREKSTGITIHKMEEGIDTGRVILQREIRISSDDTWVSLQKRISKEAGEMLVELIPLLMQDRIPSKEQEGIPTYNKKPTPEHGRLFRNQGGKFI